MQRRPTSPRTWPTPILPFLVGLLTVAQPTDAAGQRRYAGAIDAGDHVEVRLHRGEVLAGRFIRFDRNGLVLEVDNRERFLAADDIDRVWRYHDRTGDFTVGGAIGGAVAMGVTTAFFTMDVGGAALGGAAGGVLVGALAGMVAGSIASSWEEVDMALRTRAADVPLRLDVALTPTARHAGTAPSLGLRISVPAPR